MTTAKRLVILLLFATVLLLSISPLASAAPKITLATSVRDLENPFYQAVIAGAEMYAKFKGLEHVTLACNANSEKQLNDIKAIVAKTGGNVVIALWPHEPSDAVAVGRFLESSKVYFTNWVARPPDAKPEDYKYWVAHASWPNLEGGYEAAKVMAQNMKKPFSGKIFALRGQLGNDVELGRYNGLVKVISEHPEMKIIGEQEAVWQRTRGFEATSTILISNPDISAVWAANDDMALGALEALRAKGLNKKVRICGFDGNTDMIQTIINGEADSTVVVDPTYIGGMGLAIALAAKEGKINPIKLPANKRVFNPNYILITKANAQSYLTEKRKYDWDKLMSDWMK